MPLKPVRFKTPSSTRYALIKVLLSAPSSLRGMVMLLFGFISFCLNSEEIVIIDSSGLKSF